MSIHRDATDMDPAVAARYIEAEEMKLDELRRVLEEKLAAMPEFDPNRHIVIEAIANVLRDIGIQLHRMWRSELESVPVLRSMARSRARSQRTERLGAFIDAGREPDYVADAIDFGFHIDGAGEACIAVHLSDSCLVSFKEHEAFVLGCRLIAMAGWLAQPTGISETPTSNPQSPPAES